MKVYLNVRYEDRVIASSIGCKWDKVEKKWFVENPKNLMKYKHYFPDEFKNNPKLVDDIAKRCRFLHDD